MNIEELYGIYDILSKGSDSIAEHSKEYSQAIKATRGGPQEKKLAAQIIAKFFTNFPEQQCIALDALFDLCEDEDKNIRLAAFKLLPCLGKDAAHVMKITEIMAQFLHVEDSLEQTIITNVFVQLLNKCPLAAIKGVFKTIHDPRLEEPVRYKCIQFILTKIKQLDSNLLTIEVQDVMITNVKDTLQDAVGDEFVLLMTYLVSSSLGKTFSGQKEIFDLVLTQLDIENEFIAFANGNNFANRLISFVNFLLPLFSVKVESTELVKYYCDKVLPQWQSIGTLNNGLHYQVGIAQQLATMSQFCGKIATISEHIDQVYDILMNYMPEPPEDTSSNNMPDLNFTLVEALLSTFYFLARQYSEYLTGNALLLKDFRARLLYLSRGVNGCLRVINLSGSEKVFNAEEKRIREISPLLLKNISLLTRDLFYQPPSYKSKITLSFNKKEEKLVEKKQAPASPEVAATVKRAHVPITYDSNGATRSKLKRTTGGDKKYYVPPSSSSSTFRRGGFRGGRGRFGRGGFRS